MILVKWWMMLKVWKIWKYSLGSFNDETTKEYDNAVVVVRSVICACYLITNCFIVSGVIRHWNANQKSGTQVVAPVDSSAIIKLSLIHI